MNRDIAMEYRYPADFWSVRVEPLPSRSERKPAFRLSSGEALILVLLVSFGLWAAIWGLSPCWLRAGGDDFRGNVGDLLIDSRWDGRH